MKKHKVLRDIILVIGIVSASLCILLLLFMEKSAFKNFMVSISRLTGMICLFIRVVWYRWRVE